jgi:CO dehydrogenase nickel-insertion accessory protein CooC1
MLTVYNKPLLQKIIFHKIYSGVHQNLSLEQIKMTKYHIFEGKKIGVFGKGGAGKSTFTTLFAQRLAESGLTVCVLDADSTNYGLSGAMGVSTPHQSLLDFFGGMVFSGGDVTCPVDDPTPLANPTISLQDLPAEYRSHNNQNIVLLTGGKIAVLGAGAGCDGPVSKIARDLEIKHEDGDPVTLVDFKAGFEDSARGVITGLDYGIVVIDPTTASIQLAEDMQRMLDQVHNLRPPATAHLESPDLAAAAQKIYRESKIKDLFFILNKIPDHDTENYLRSKLESKHIQADAVLPVDPVLSCAWLEENPLESQQAEPELDHLIQTIQSRMLQDQP